MDSAGPAAPIDWSEMVWHPLLAAVETTPGTWFLLDSYGQPHSVVRMVRRGDELGYRAETWTPEPDLRDLVGYYRTLRAATKAAHMRYVASLGNPGPPIAWGAVADRTPDKF